MRSQFELTDDEGRYAFDALRASTTPRVLPPTRTPRTTTKPTPRPKAKAARKARRRNR